MTNKLIAFIICTYDKELIRECSYYINELEVPEGFIIDIITIEEAESRVEAYNAGMESSEAEYKVYLDESTYIRNHEFLIQCLNLFQGDPSIKVIGFNQVDTYKEHRIDEKIIICSQDFVWKDELFENGELYCERINEWNEDKWRVFVPEQTEEWCCHGVESYPKVREPLVSVLLCVYNAGQALKDTIDSIIAQTYQHLEIIIVDDASTDESRSIILSYQDRRIQTIFLDENENVCNAGNIAFSHANGEYIALIGHDDLWMSEKIERQINFMEHHSEYGVCFSWCDIIDEYGKNGNVKNEPLQKRFHEHNYKQSDWIAKMIHKGNFFCAPSACIRSELLEKTGVYRYGLVQLQDFDLWLRCLKYSNVYLIPEKLVKYRRFHNVNKNLSSETEDNISRTVNETHYIINRYIEELTPDQFRRLLKEELCDRNAASFHEIRCEKLLLRIRLKNGMAVQNFIDLLEDEECRRILHEKYQIRLNDFYNMNFTRVFFDQDIQDYVDKQNQLLDQYRKIVEYKRK